jgi:hypothetical protein
MVLANKSLANMVRCILDSADKTNLFGVVVFYSWYLAEELVRGLARRRKDWMSLLNKNSPLKTASIYLRGTNGWTIKLPGPCIAVEELVPLISANAYRPVTVRERTYWCFTLAVRIPGLGKVRIVVSFEHQLVTGRYIVHVTRGTGPDVRAFYGVSPGLEPFRAAIRSDLHREGSGPHRERKLDQYRQHDPRMPPPIRRMARGRAHAIAMACLGRFSWEKRFLVIYDQLTN